jgi:hypothetical protein
MRVCAPEELLAILSLELETAANRPHGDDEQSFLSRCFRFVVETEGPLGRVAVPYFWHAMAPNRKP